MILSYKYKYIFMHCRKTAGSSIAASLSANLGEDDILLGGIEEAISLGIDPPKRIRSAAFKHRPLHLIASRAMGKRQYAAALSEYAKKYFSEQLGRKPQHITAKNMRAAFPTEWESFFKFCVVRNPYDRAVSDYYWRCRDLHSPPSFETFMQALECNDSLGGIVPVGLHSNWPIYTIDDEVAVDAVCRYEELPGILEDGLKQARIPFEGIVTKAKSSHRSARARNYTEVHTPVTRGIVARLYEKEILTFGYKFEG